MITERDPLDWNSEERWKSPNVDGKESSWPLNILSMSVGGGGGASVLV